MTQKMFDKIHKQCIEFEKAELKKLVGVEFDDIDIEQVEDICRAVLDLRDKYMLGNVDTRDCADEINAVMPLVHKLLAAEDLYKTDVVEELC